MGTSATVAVVEPTGSVKSIYVHYDGYYNHTGKILRDHWNEQHQAQQLIELGDASYIDVDIHQCKFYGRDSGESDTSAESYSSLDHFLRVEHEDYCYLHWDNKWWMVLDGEILDPQQALAKIQRETF